MISLEIDIKKETLSDIKNLCEMMGYAENDFINEIIENKLNTYRNDSGRINKKEGMFWDNRLEFEWKKSQGETCEKHTSPCYIIGKTTMYGEPYYQIIHKNKFMKVPFACISINKTT